MANAPVDDIYLFLFQPKVEVWEGNISIQVPQTKDAYYWAFDPSGITRLSDEDAKEIGVPQVLLDTRITGNTWTQQDYEIMDEIQIAQGFNPDTTELANTLGYPLAIVHEKPIETSLEGVVS
jgi:hypothetical protein